MRYASVDIGKQVSQIGLGTWQFGSKEWGYGPDYDEREAAAIVRRAVELGVTVFDTAEIYGMGRSERILGAALRAAGADVEGLVIATKLFPVLPIAPVVQQRALASAHRLGVRRLDLYQVHQPNPLVKDGTTMRGMSALIDVGVVGHAGVSNYSLERWQAADRALAEASPGSGRVVLSNQVQYSLVQRAPERDLIPFAETNGRMVMAYSPLGQGLLSGRFAPGDRVDGVRRANPHFLPDNLTALAPLLDVLRDVASTRQVKPSQVALAWTIRHRCVVAIPGASSVEQLESNVAAAELELTLDEITAIDETAATYRPTTGLAAAPAVAKAMLRSRT